MKILFFIFALMSLSAALGHARADVVRVTDDEGQTLEFTRPVSRIISLSPHATEILFAAGASDQIIATVSFSDYPAAAKNIPRIGNYKKIDLESIIALKPELIIGWKGGGSLPQIEAMQKLGYRIYFSEPETFDEVASNLRNLGKLLGTSTVAEAAADNFLAELAQLKRQFQNKTPVSVFYQVWNQPLMTINKDHLITTVIEFCGGRNIFADLPARAPRVSIEAVIEKDPQAIVIGMSETRNEWLTEWQRWATLSAVKHQQLYPIEADLIVRQTPRILQGAQLMCQHLDKARKNALQGK